MRFDKFVLYKSGSKVTAVGIFKIDFYNLRWFDANKDDADDLCLHGHAVAYIGNKKLEYECTVSAMDTILCKTFFDLYVQPD